MAPRAYEGTRRAEMAQATRRRIIDATVALHAEKGIAATTLKDIARRADVGWGTVYHHFPTYDDVVRACGAHMSEVTRPPTPQVFAGIRSPTKRVGVMVREIFAYYERYPQFERGRCDRDRFEALRLGVARREQLLESVVREAVRPLRDGEACVSTLVALTDFAVYRALTTAGMSTGEAAARVTDVVLAWITRERTTSRRRVQPDMTMTPSTTMNKEG